MEPKNEHCPTSGCEGVDTFYRFVVDIVDATLDGETGEFQTCGDSDQLKDESQGVFCSECGLCVSILADKVAIN